MIKFSSNLNLYLQNETEIEIDVCWNLKFWSFHFHSLISCNSKNMHLWPHAHEYMVYLIGVHLFWKSKWIFIHTIKESKNQPFWHTFSEFDFFPLFRGWYQINTIHSSLEHDLQTYVPMSNHHAYVYSNGRSSAYIPMSNVRISDLQHIFQWPMSNFCTYIPMSDLGTYFLMHNFYQ